MAVMSYSEIIHELESRGVMPDRTPSLEPMQNALEILLPKLNVDPSKTILVAGTNGKGSVCATLEALFMAAGETVGLYTSPHLVDTTERIRIQGQDISQELFSRAYQQILRILNTPEALNKIRNVKFSHFEMLTLMAAWIFYSGKDSPRVDRSIFEVGLGGTWDATNAIPHTSCVITPLGYDHQNLLGSTLSEIASNKFGIVTRESVVVHAPLPDEVKKYAKEVEALTHSKWRECIPFNLKIDKKERTPIFTLQTPWGDAPLSLAGKRAAQNSAIALTLFQELGYAPKLYLSVLKHVRWPGRMEKISSTQTGCPIYVSGDHNPQGIQSLLELLTDYPRNHLFILAGIGKDKDQDGILNPLFSLENSSIYLTEIPFRGRSINDYGSWLNHAQGAWPDPMQALQELIKLAKPNDMILVTGSLYLVGYIKQQL